MRLSGDINALCHRNYTEVGTIQIRIYDDRLEVWNPGKMPSDLTVAELYRQHADCWLRTPSGNVPSDFISRTALANLLHANIRSLAKNPVTQFILRKQTSPQITREKPVDRKRKAA